MQKKIRNLNFYLFIYFLRSFLSLFSFWDPYNVNIGVFNVVPEVSYAVFTSFPSFFHVLRQWFPPFCLPSHLSVLLPQLFCCWFFQCIVHLCLFFSSSRSLVNISCIFSILFPRSWIIFTVIILNSFFGMLLISILFSCFSEIFILSLHLGHDPLPFHFA